LELNVKKVKTKTKVTYKDKNKKSKSTTSTTSTTTTLPQNERRYWKYGWRLWKLKTAIFKIKRFFRL